MAKRTENTVKLGIFITIGAVLFIVAVYFIGNEENMFGANLRISTIFSNVNGLQPGNNVRYSGINVGTVESIVLLNDTTVQVNMKLEKKVRPFIKKDAIASIGSDGLVGSMLVNISPGKGNSGIVEEGDIIDSYSRVETDELLNTLGKTNENIALISNDLLRITSQMVKGKGTIAMLLRDTMLAISLRQSVLNLQATSAHLAAMGGELQQMMAEAKGSTGLLHQLLHDTTVISNLNSSIDQADTVAAQLGPFIREMQQSAESLSAASATLKAMLEELESGQGAAGLLLKDSAAAEDLRQILENLNEGAARFNENMEAMKYNFLFRRYFKKKAKEGEGGEP